MANNGISDFSVRFSAALQGFMRERRVRVDDIARVSGRSKGFVSDHTSGKKAPDTDMLDAVSELAGITTSALVAEIVRRMDHPAAARSDAGEAGADAVITSMDKHLGRTPRSKSAMQQMDDVAAREDPKSS